MNFKKVVLVVLIALPNITMAGSVGGFGGATEVTQLLNKGLMTSQLGQQVDTAINTARTVQENIRQYQKMVEQYQVMYENAKRLPDHVQNQILNDLEQLARIISEGRAVSYAGGEIEADREYQRAHRDFEYYENRNADPDNLRDQYLDWSQTNHDTVRGALNAAGLQASQFSTEDGVRRQIMQQLQTADGTNQILQAAGTIADQQIGQLQKLRQLQMAQIQIMASSEGAKVDKQAREDADWLHKSKSRTLNQGSPINLRDIY